MVFRIMSHLIRDPRECNVEYNYSESYRSVPGDARCNYNR